VLVGVLTVVVGGAVEVVGGAVLLPVFRRLAIAL
jgi:hypothetical protein